MKDLRYKKSDKKKMGRMTLKWWEEHLFVAQKISVKNVKWYEDGKWRKKMYKWKGKLKIKITKNNKQNLFQNYRLTKKKKKKTSFVILYFSREIKEPYPFFLSFFFFSANQHRLWTSWQKLTGMSLCTINILKIPTRTSLHKFFSYSASTYSCDRLEKWRL